MDMDYADMMSKSQSKNIKVCTCDTFPCTCGAIDNQEILYKLSQGNYSATYYVHKTAIIESGVAIGNGTKIWHHSHVCWGAHIGNNCTIGQNVYIGKNVYIGNNCKIQNNVYIPEGVEIESDVFLGPSVTFTNILNPRAAISRKEEFKSTVVEIGASIGANATILCDNVIGRYAMIGAGAVVTKDVDEFKVAFGNPAEVVGIISKDGSDINYYGWRY